jgi:glutathione S-transferase
MNATAAPYRLYGEEISYFSAKVRCALRLKGLWFEEIRRGYPEAARRTGLQMIPIVVTPEDETWQDSTDIFDHLEALHPEPPLLPATPCQRIAALLVELYVDEIGLLPGAASRWGTPARAEASVAYFVGLFGPKARQSADAVMALAKEVGVDESSRPAIEAHTQALLVALSAHFEQHAYLLGERMSYADCALMGLLYGHLFNDLESRGVLLETATPVVGWIDRCDAPAGFRGGAWADDDALTPTLHDVLRVMGEGAPLILDTQRCFEAWAADADPSEELPRAVGTARADLRGVTIERIALSYSRYMLQRLTDAVAALAPADRAAVGDALDGTGWEPVLDATPVRRVRKRDFRLELEPPA